jgi:hypothetical protein
MTLTLMKAGWRVGGIAKAYSANSICGLAQYARAIAPSDDATLPRGEMFQR